MAQIFKPIFNNISYKRMALAVVVSLILHAIFFGGFIWKPPSLNHNNSHMIEAQLVKRPPPKLQDAKPVKLKKKDLQKKVSQKKNPTLAPDIKADEPASASDGTSVVPVEVPNEVTQYVSEPSAPFIMPEDEPAAKPYAYVLTTFDVKRAQDASAAGTAKIIYQALPNQHYLLTSEMNAKGILSLFVQQRKLSSEGLITDKGLQPNNFKYEVAGNKDKTTDTYFDWPNKTITFYSSRGENKLVLPDGTQDLLSFMYQFMFVPPLNEIQFNVTNGRTIREYDYVFYGEEMLDTKLGPLNTVHLHRANEDREETIDLWLAPDYLYLPVKITQTNKKGTVELFITRLQTDAPVTE